MVCVWPATIAALYIGRAFGKRKLAPRLSPGKTWAGSIASILGSMIAGGIVIAIADTLTAHGNTLLHISEPLWQSLLLAAILNIAAQLGDLLESAIKRGAGVKDSGTMLPGHGGILDRIDALLLAAPVLWYILLLKDTSASAASKKLYWALARFFKAPPGPPVGRHKSSPATNRSANRRVYPSRSDRPARSGPVRQDSVWTPKPFPHSTKSCSTPKTAKTRTNQGNSRGALFPSNSYT